MDRFRSEQVFILLQRAEGNTNLAKAWNISPELLINVGRVLPSFAKIGFTSAAGARLAFGIGRPAVTAGLHVTGLVFAAVIIPFDLGQMVYSSIKLGKKKRSNVVNKLRYTADGVEHALRKYMVKEGYFRLVATHDGHWAYVDIHEEKKALFEAKLRQRLTLSEVKELGEIVESGKFEVPEETRQKMYEEWFSHAEENVKLIHTTDKYGAYVEVYAKKKALFKEKLSKGITLNEIEEFGSIVESWKKNRKK